MVERLHPGVYTEERRRGLAPIQGVSTSNFGTAGFALKGPSNVATLVTSFDSFERTFGGLTGKSQAPTHMFAYFSNGGQRAYFVRVVPSDAVVADGFMTSDLVDESLATGDGSQKDYSSGGAGPLAVAHPPIEPSSVNLTYRSAGAAVSGEAQTPSQTPDGSIVDFTFEIQNSDPIVPGTVTIATTVSAVTVDYKDGDNAGGYAPSTGDEGQGRLYDDGANLRGFIDYETGRVTLSVETVDAPDSASSITADYTPADTVHTITDDGAGNLTSTSLTLDTGTIDYATGEMEIVINAASDAPANGQDLLVDYTQRIWDLDPISAGAWGNDLQLRVRGNEDYFSRDTAQYSRYDVLVALEGAVEEIYEAVSLTDSLDSDYVATSMNADNGSDLINLVEPSNEDVAPAQLNGSQRVFIAGGGDGVQVDFGSTDGSDGTPTIPTAVRSAALPTEIQPTSLEITYVDVSGQARTITDDGDGNLQGDVDSGAPAGSNFVDYETGDFAFRVPAGQEPSQAETSHSATPTGTEPDSLITATFYLVPSSSLATDDLSGGDDGTNPVTRSELTDPSLLASRQGIYALLKTDELMNVAVPDAAGNVTMATDLITEAERNEKWFIILAPPPDLTPQEVKSFRRNDLGITSSYGALYYPYITIADPVTGNQINIPPAGHIAGVYARTDTQANVGTAPAGVTRGALQFSTGLARKLEFSEIDVFYPSQVNALIDTPQTGRVVWGSRTLESPPGDFSQIQVRRLFNFLKASIFNSTHGFVFENVGAALRSRITLSVESFMRNLFNQGNFKGATPDEAFNVICDESNNPPEVENANTVICDVFVAPNEPGEFIVFRIQQKFEST